MNWFYQVEWPANSHCWPVKYSNQIVRSFFDFQPFESTTSKKFCFMTQKIYRCCIWCLQSFCRRCLFHPHSSPQTMSIPALCSGYLPDSGLKWKILIYFCTFFGLTLCQNNFFRRRRFSTLQHYRQRREVGRKATKWIFREVSLIKHFPFRRMKTIWTTIKTSHYKMTALSQKMSAYCTKY